MDKYINLKWWQSIVKVVCEKCRDTCEEYDGFYADCNQCSLGEVKKAIDELSEVVIEDAEPVRHGRWIEKRWPTEDDWGVINWHSLTCSACDHEERTNGLSPNSIYKYDYCPWCGALMDEEGDGE